MIRPNLLLCAASGLALLGWRSASRRAREIEARYQQAISDLVDAEEDATRLAGRVAWHAGDDPMRPPQHLVPADMVEHYAAGFETERAAEDLAAAGWDRGVGR